ncbi:sensor histidine kinase [Cohnella suwonensis]|uniref:Sensor histidine kinase n=1 Tax=Cohnella suwonensis TaxID=696072 RepID=A0ABW0M3R6_9BACL
MRGFGIRNRLFVSFTFIISFIIASLSIFFYTRIADILMERSLESSNQTLRRVDASLVQVFRDLDRISAQVLYSPVFQNRFEEAFAASSDSYEGLDLKKSLEMTLSTLNGPSFIAQQINVFNLNGDLITYGLKIDPYDDLKERMLRTEWLDAVMKRDGDKYLVPPRKDTWFQSDGLVFSLVRFFPNNAAFSPKFVEVQQSYDKLVDIIGDAAERSDLRLFVFDGEGRSFYPADASAKSKPPFAWSDIPAGPSGEKGHFIRTADGTRYLLDWVHSPSYGLSIVAALPESELLAPVNALRDVVITVTIAAELIALLLAYVIASSITKPIRLILRDIKRWDLERLHIRKAGNGDRTYAQASHEIQELFDGFFSLKARLNQSVELALEAQRRESQAQLHALQAQMQPHFVFNTLSSIGVLAEQEGAEQAAAMCHSMMQMMAYISRRDADQTELGEELRFTRNYLELMKLRYQEHFEFDIEAEEALYGLAFPKLVLQPIVENSFAHGFRSVHPPWWVRVVVRPGEQGGFSIRISDNGVGFGKDALGRIERFAEDLEIGRYVSPDNVGKQGIGGMGLENALMRLYLFYGGAMSFRVSNLEEGMELEIAFGAKREDTHVQNRRG